MQLKIRIVILFCFCLMQHALMAQQKKAEKIFQEALTAYRSYDYSEALLKLNHAIKFDKQFINAYLLQAEIYQDMDSITKQIKALNSALTLGEKSNKMLFILAEAHYSIGAYEDALNTLLKIPNSSDLGTLKDKVSSLNAKCTHAIELMNNSVNFNPELLSRAINSSNNEYWPCISINDSTLTFTRLLPSKHAPQEDFYQSTKQDNGEWSEAMPITELNTSDNEGAQSITADGKLFFFTACGRNDGLGSCDIFYSINTEGRWSKPCQVGNKINSAAWEAQPAISADGSYLYFSSNRKDGKGKKDIWRCALLKIDEQNKLIWGDVENLGDSINTPGDEISPFIHPDGKSLYFASDTWYGLGKTDIFLSKLQSDSSWSKAKNIGYPINSYLNEQGFIVSANGKTAYYASDKVGSNGIDIYSFKLPKEVQPTPVINDFGKLDELAVGNSIVLENIFFNYNSVELLPESYSELNKLIALFSEFPSLKIEIEGHTDNQGSAEYNLRLSSQRAESVYNYLVKQGVNKEDLSFKGYGDKHPIDSNETEIGRAKNRRTEFRIVAIQ